MIHPLKGCVCVCVCVTERERRERESGWVDQWVHDWLDGWVGGWMGVWVCRCMGDLMYDTSTERLCNCVDHWMGYWLDLLMEFHCIICKTNTNRTNIVMYSTTKIHLHSAGFVTLVPAASS